MFLARDWLNNSIRKQIKCALSTFAAQTKKTTMTTSPKTPEMPEQDPFVFLFPEIGQPRFQLMPPDLLELRWSLWDRFDRRTLSFGTSPKETVLTGMCLAEALGLYKA